MEDTAASSKAETDLQLQLAAAEGFITNLQRQLVRAKGQLQAVETKYQEKVEETDHKLSSLMQQLQNAVNKVEQLSQENRTLQQEWEDERQEKEAAMQTVKELQEKCDHLELEKDKIMKEEAVLHSSLRKAHKEMSILKERQGEMGVQGAPPELAAEVAHMRKVIKNLRDMVMAQREHLGNCGKALSMSSHPRSFHSSPVHSGRDPSSVESDTSPLGSSGRSGSSQLGQSWEMINLSRPASLSTRRQQEQQQKQQLMAMQQRCVTSTASNMLSSPQWDPQGTVTNTMVMGQAMVNGGVDAGRATITNDVVSPKMWGSQSVMIPRPQGQIPAARPKNKTEVVRTRTAAPPFSRSEDWVDGDSPQEQAFREGGTSQPAAAKLSPFQQITAGLNQFPLDPIALTEPATVQSKPSPVGVSPAVYPPPYEQVLFKGPSDMCNTDAHNTSAPSMHILNQGVMAGARVIRNDSDSFGNSGGTILTNRLLPGLSAPINRNISVGSGVPQEHVDMTEFNSSAMSELSPLNEQTNFSNMPVNVINQVGKGLDRKCPVCGQDFSHISMDEFQFHVFECFDNADENSSAPDTLQPQSAEQPAPNSTWRVCPMCDKTFPENSSQQFFEGHVQSHFEVGADQFEILEVKEA